MVMFSMTCAHHSLQHMLWSWALIAGKFSTSFACFDPRLLLLLLLFLSLLDNIGIQVWT